MKTKLLILLSFILVFLIIGCNSNKSNQKIISDTSIKKNTNYANIFKPLDGTWESKFYIYEDTLGQREGTAQPIDISYEYLQTLPLKLKSIVEAKHIYKSETPFLQRGEIIDTYIDAEGNKYEAISTAINKIENGKISCIVKKPNETIIHQGEYVGDNTIIWHRNVKDPFRIEYFKETVDSQHYRIVGWGYYGNDDPVLTPRTWFYADYIQVK